MCSTPLDRVLLAWLISRRFGQRSVIQEEEPRRRHLSHPVVSQRVTKGHFYTLYHDLRHHPEKFQHFCRMSIDTFDCLLVALRPGLTFRDRSMRRCISPEERLVITLRFLATGNSFASLHIEFLLGTSTISRIVRVTCEAIWRLLRETVMPQPTAQDWHQIADDYLDSTQFPNCIGALGRKHIRVRKPACSGSRYPNHKQFFSVMLLAMADSNYRFVIVDIGAYGSTADSRVFRASRMSERIQSNMFSLPEPRPLPGSSGPPAPFVIVADKGFALSPHVMRPFPRRCLDSRRRIFNYRLTRAHRYVEFAFRILSNKWRVLMSAIQMDNVTLVTQACVILHNFTRIHDTGLDTDIEDLYSTEAVPLDQMLHGRPRASGLANREIFADYFLTPEGSVPCQQDSIRAPC